MNILQPSNALFFCGLVVYIAIRHRFIKFTKSEQKIVRQVDATEKNLLAGMSIAVLLLPVLYLFTPLLSLADYQLPASVPWFGTALLLASLWLFWRSHVDLGKNWSVSLEVCENHQLMTHGVYRYIRHPMYASIWMWGLAQGMLLHNWLAGWAVLPAFAAMYFIRTPREERLMVDTFGEAYHQYAARTGRLVPRWRSSIAMIRKV